MLQMVSMCTLQHQCVQKAQECIGGELVAKFHARPSLQYRYEHYDPRF